MKMLLFLIITLTNAISVPMSCPKQYIPDGNPIIWSQNGFFWHEYLTYTQVLTTIDKLKPYQLDGVIEHLMKKKKVTDYHNTLPSTSLFS
jgi:hypothetical protein